ncbi:MAG: hypothetical protein NT037_01770 [Hyphomicrobiales bacterium]|nr:hypothetical protein [Hyphomicrobiales bacterium]
MKLIRNIGIILLIAAAAALAYQYARTWATLRAAVPPLGPVGQRMLQDLAREGSKESRWLSMQRVAVSDMAAASAAIEKREVDVALVRSDVALPRNGRSIAVFQTLYAFLIVPPRSQIEDFRGVKDRVVAIVPGDAANEKLLDLVLDHYGVPRASVRRQSMTAEEVGPAMQQRKVAAAFVIGPLGGVSFQTFQSIQKSMKGAPTVLGVEDAEAVRRLSTGVDAAEVSKGVFGGSPAQPEEDLTTIGVTIRMVVPAGQSGMIAGELTRALFEGKSKALAGNPQMREMQQPNAEEKDYPIHPAAQAYFDGEAPTFMDRFETLFWIGSVVLGLLGSLFGWLLSKVRAKPRSKLETHFEDLTAFVADVRKADLQQLDDLQQRLDTAVVTLFDQRESSEMSADAVALYSVAIDYARGVLADRRAQLVQEPVDA